VQNIGLFFKKLLVPKSNAIELVDAVQLWEVRWQSRHGAYSGDVRPEMEAFTSLDEASRFQLALENAFRLIRTTSGTKVFIEKGVSANGS
jgi:hypothetical protein